MIIRTFFVHYDNEKRSTRSTANLTKSHLSKHHSVFTDLPNGAFQNGLLPFQNVCFETNKMDPYILALMEDEELEEIFAEDVEMEDVDGKF